MFFIVNKTKTPITIGDISVSLGPRQAIDLDKVMSRDKSESSKSLKVAVRRGDIEIRVKDILEAHSPSPANNSVNDIGDIKKEIVGEMKSFMKELLQNQGGGISKEDLKEIISSIPKQEAIVYQSDQKNNVIKKDEEVEIDDTILSAMGARAVNNIVKNTEIKASKYEENKTDNTILSNIDELESLLG
jgi:hypothetical protein